MEIEIENYEFNRATLDAAPIGVTIFSDDLEIIECNDEILNLLQTTKKDYIERFFDHAPEFQPNGDNSYEKVSEVIKRAFKGENLTFEWSHLSTAGELMPFEITLTRTKYRGKYAGLAYQYDLRHIRQITEELKRQSELLKVRLEQQELISDISRSFISSGEMQSLINKAIAKLGCYYRVSVVAVFSFDNENTDAHLAYYWSENNTLPRKNKFSMPDLIKRSFPQKLYDNSSVPVFSCAYTSVNNADFFRELLAIGINAFICAPLYVEGRLWGMLAAEQNYAARRWTDNEKNFVAMAASTIAGAITLDIYNNKLKDAVTKERSASRAKSEFLSNMSHEMRTPMNAIINMTLIAKNSADIEQKNYALDKIGDASSHLLGVINDILDMSKIEANKFELMPVRFNFEKMLKRVVNEINFRVEEKQQKLFVQVDKDFPKVLIGDDQRISQIITNLLGNAVKFTPENGSISLNALFLGEVDGACSIQVSVSDTGIGISKEHQKSLFQSFQQAETSTARNFGGTGLGLSISKSFVEMMGGKIWVESEYNKGSVFSFRVQVQRADENEECPDKEKKQKETITCFSGHKILLVEDIEINREIVLMLLESTHLDVECAVNGIQAVEMFMEDPSGYEMIFMDIHMPGMDGYEATRQIRSFEKKINDKKSGQKTGRIPIIAMTANVFKDDIESCINAGMDDHIGKPLDIEVIREKLNIYLSLRA